MTTDYVHVDVFSSLPYSGNSLAVFPDARGLTAMQMLRITQELRHFETVFFEPAPQSHTVRARVLGLFEELPFAGHPVIGRAAVLQLESCAPTRLTTRMKPQSEIGGALAGLDPAI